MKENKEFNPKILHREVFAVENPKRIVVGFHIFPDCQWDKCHGCRDQPGHCAGRNPGENK